MPNLTISEILTIMLVILVIFGPQRLPEMAKKAGEYISRARGMVNELRTEFEGEWEDVAKPLKDVREEIQGVRQDLRSSMQPLNDDLLKAKQEIEDEIKNVKGEMDDQISEAKRELNEPSDGSSETGSDGDSES